MTSDAWSLAGGAACGFLVCIPVGPVNLTVINRALRRGFLAALITGLGAMTAETAYASLALAGHSWLNMNPTTMLVARLVALLAIAAMGVRNVLSKPERLVTSEQVAAQTVKRWHHPRSFLLGFALAISNPLLVVLWATVAAVLAAHQWVPANRTHLALSAGGVFLGGSLWYGLVSAFVSRAHRRISPRSLTILVRSSGCAFLGMAGLLAFKTMFP